MVAVEALQRQVVVYRSADLRSWTFASRFGPAASTEGVWECPGPFEVPGAATLTLTTVSGRDSLAGDSVDAATGVLTLDRRECGAGQLGEAFVGVVTASLVRDAATVDLLVVVDGCVVEVYAQGGLVTLTALVFPSAPLAVATWS